MSNAFRKAGVSTIAALTVVLAPHAITANAQEPAPCCGTWAGKLQLDNNGDGKFSKDVDAYLVGSTVELVSVSSPERGVVSTSGVSDSGTFEFKEVPFGRYVARVQVPEGFGLSPLASGWAAEVPELEVVRAAAPETPDKSYVYSEAVEVSEGANAVTFQDPLFVPTVGKVSGSIWFETDGDGVREESDVTGATPEVEVQLMRRATPDGSMEPIEEPWARKTSSAKDGKFLFKHLPAGEYQLLYRYPRGLTFSADGVDNNATRQVSEGRVSEPFRISATQKSVTLNAALTYRFAGDVYFDANGDGKRQVTERGAAKVKVEVRDGADVVASVDTDANGRYYFTDIADGRYSVRVIAPKPWQAAVNTDRLSDAVTFDVAVNGNEVAGLREVRLLPPAHSTSGSARETLPFIEPPKDEVSEQPDFGYGPNHPDRPTNIATLTALWNVFGGGGDAETLAFAPQAGLKNTLESWFRLMLCKLGISSNCR